RQLVSEAREAMESAARCGEQPPPWVQAFMSPAGWKRYNQLRQEAGYCDETAPASTELAPHTGGVAGCSPSGNDTPANHMHNSQGQRQLRASAQTMPETHETVKGIAADHGNLLRHIQELEVIRD